LDGDTPGKLGIIPDRRGGLEWFPTKRHGDHVRRVPKDGAAADQAVGEVTAHQTFDRYGP
jgi:hypothetical protein